MWYDDLNKETKREVNCLIGVMNLGEPAEYADLAAFLYTITDRVVSAKYLARQAANELSGGGKQ